MDISGWLKRNSKDDDSWKGRRAIPDDAVIFNASDGPKLSTFIGELRHFTKFPSSTYSGPSVDYLERFIIERTTLTSDHARQLESISAAHLVLSNCEITDDVAKSLAKIKVIQSLTFDQLHISEQALMSFGAIDCYSLTLKPLRISTSPFQRYWQTQSCCIALMTTAIAAQPPDWCKKMKASTSTSRSGED